MRLESLYEKIDYFVGWTAIIFNIMFFSYRAIQITSSTIKNKNSIKDTPFFPTIINYLNSIIWLKYGFYIKDQTTIVVNIFALISTGYVIWFYYILSDENTGIFLSTFFGITFLFFYLLALKLNFKYIPSLPLFSSIFSIFVISSPLISFYIVDPLYNWFFPSKKQKRKNNKKLENNQTMSLGISIISFFGCFFWLFHGILLKNLNIAIPNAISLIIASFQLFMVAFS